MSNNKPTEQEREQRLREAVNKAYIKYWHLDEHEEIYHAYLEDIDVMYNFAKSEAVKKYHQPNNKAVDLDEIHENLFDIITGNISSDNKIKEVIKLITPYLSTTPTKALSEEEIEKLKVDLEYAENGHLAIQKDYDKLFIDNQELTKQLQSHQQLNKSSDAVELITKRELQLLAALRKMHEYSSLDSKYEANKLLNDVANCKFE